MNHEREGLDPSPSFSAVSGSIIGVLIRSTSNFLGVTCYKNDLDVDRWWPWYVLRSVLAFVVGTLVVVLVKSDLLASSQKATDVGLGWLGLAALAGFGLEDVLQRFRGVSKTLFASESTTDVRIKARGTRSDSVAKGDPPDVGPVSTGDGAIPPAHTDAPLEDSGWSNRNRLV